MREGTAYVPPLRFAVRWCIESAKGAGITVDVVATIAQVAQDRAAAFLSILTARGALTPDGPGRFVAGPAWGEWVAVPSKSRPKRGGSAAAEEMDQMRRTLCRNIAARRLALGLSQAEVARRAGIYHVYVQRAEKFHDPPPACALVLLAKALGATVEQLVEPTASLVGVG